MRRRWEVNDSFWYALLYVYIFGWLPVFFGIGAIWGHGFGPHDDVPVGGYVFIAAWFGPAVVLGAGALLYLLGSTLWQNRPRRVAEPVTEDLRTAPR